MARTSPPSRRSPKPPPPDPVESVEDPVPVAPKTVPVSAEGEVEWVTLVSREVRDSEHRLPAELVPGRYVIRGTNNGISAIIDPQGQRLEESAQFVQTVVRGQVVPMKGSTPFMLWGSRPLIIAIALLMAAFIVWGWRRSHQREKPDSTG